MNIDYLYKILLGVLLTILGFISSSAYTKLCTIEADLVSVKVQLQKLQSEQVSISRVHDIAKYEIYQYFKK